MRISHYPFCHGQHIKTNPWIAQILTFKYGTRFCMILDVKCVFFKLQFILLCITIFFLDFNIKSLRDSHIIHFAKIERFFITSTLKWCIFLNLLIIDWEIPPMFNSLIICKKLMKKMRTINLIFNNTWEYFTLMIQLVNQHTYTNFENKIKSQYSHITNIYIVF
jgi:hypothetical protein